MKTLLKQPCPHCQRYTLNRTDRDEAYCMSCFTTQTIGPKPLDKPDATVPADMIRPIRGASLRG